MQVKLSKFFKTTAILGGIFSFGVVPLILWFQSRTFPKHIDTTGIKLRNGKHYLWAQLKKATPHTILNSRGQRMGGKLVLEFDIDGKKLKKVDVVPASYKQGHGVIDHINALLGTDFISG